MTTVPASPPRPPTDQWYPVRSSAEAILAPLVALLGAAVLFSIFLLFLGASPLDGRTLDAALQSEATWAQSTGALDVRLVTAGAPVPVDGAVARELLHVVQAEAV